MNRMIKWLVGKMVQCGACTADDTDVMCYGLDLLFSCLLYTSPRKRVRKPEQAQEKKRLLIY